MGSSRSRRLDGKATAPIGAAGPVSSSLSKLDNAHYSTRRAPARTAQNKDTRDLHMHRKHEER